MKIWLNDKYIKIKRNQKLESEFFGFLWVLYPVKKQAYKLKLPKKWRIHDIFHVLLLKQNTTRKKQVEENVTQLEFRASDHEEYKIEGICNNIIFAKELEIGYLLVFYYLIFWKDYLKEKNT